MSHAWSRRMFIRLTSGLPLLCAPTPAARAGAQAPGAAPSLAADVFPAQDPSLVREVVGAAHRDLERVQELVERRPALVRASMDWGFGDWETCIDAASHVGNRTIAEFLITNGARPTLFTAAMLGQLDVVRACVAARPSIVRNPGPHGLTLMWHARQGGSDAAAVVEYLTKVGGADEQPTTAPLSTADRDAIVGRYTYGAGARDAFAIDVRRDMAGRDQVGLERSGSPTRQTLHHVGNLVFFPAGVPSVRIAFALQGARATHVTVADPDVFLTARRD